MIVFVHMTAPYLVLESEMMLRVLVVERTEAEAKAGKNAIDTDGDKSRTFKAVNPING